MSGRTRLAVAAGACATLFAAPGATLGHTLTERYEAPLPLVAYVAGAALAVAMSFAFVMLRNVPVRDATPRQARNVPAWLRTLLSAIGLIGWGWIVLQTLFGGSGVGDVASLFLWVYGWVGLALVSALIGPAWSWIDPFTTLHRILAAVGGRLGIGGGEPAPLPPRLVLWPAVIGFAALVWVELVAQLEGGRPLGLLVIAYTFVTLAGMSYFGREEWRRNAEIFTVWFRTLGRLAPIELVGEPEDGRVRRRTFGAGLVRDWSTPELVLVVLGTGAIIFDGLSQTQLYFDTFSAMDVLGSIMLRDTLIAAAFFGALLAVVLAVARLLGTEALGAGLLPVAVGYLVAHYLTYLLVDGQGIIAAINDPLRRGDNLLPFELATYEPTLFISPAIVWSIQLAGVVGGHIVGAWAGHAALVDEGRGAPAEQLPLAALMVTLTSITLWSLGQAVLAPPVT